MRYFALDLGEVLIVKNFYKYPLGKGEFVWGIG